MGRGIKQWIHDTLTPPPGCFFVSVTFVVIHVQVHLCIIWLNLAYSIGSETLADTRNPFETRPEQVRWIENIIILRNIPPPVIVNLLYVWLPEFSLNLDFAVIPVAPGFILA